jgi:hypothetical protein
LRKALFNRKASREIVHLVSVAAMLFAATAHGARPFVTDDARIVEPGGYQIETFIKRQHTFGEREFWFLPAHTPGTNVELTLGGIWISHPLEEQTRPRTLLAQAKTLLRKLETNGTGFALTLGVLRQSANTNPYVNGIASFSLANDLVVIHSNLGARRDAEEAITRGTWGLGAEIALHHRLFAIAESFGERGQSPTRHIGLRFWVLPNHMQIDTTLGQQYGNPERRFHTIGLRLLW